MNAWMRMCCRVFLLGILLIDLAGCASAHLGMLNPKGIITYEERKLFFDTLALMLIVVLPVIIMSFAFVYHYQASHRVRDYKPNWSHSYFLESLWWGIPCIIIFVLAVLTWQKTHELDPYRPISGQTQPPLLIQAIALPWKWLFIYPAQNIATLNYVVIPVNTQVEFWLTTDNAPMSAFFIPQLGSQIYAMAGMRTRLHLLANQTGIFRGLNTQYNGAGFSDMNFPVYVVDNTKMQQWVHALQQAAPPLNEQTYTQLLNPSEANPPAYFANVIPNLFESVVMLYMQTFGPTHPRDNQIKFQYPLHTQKD